jgi:hypothetical protein
MRKLIEYTLIALAVYLMFGLDLGAFIGFGIVAILWEAGEWAIKRHA